MLSKHSIESPHDLGANPEEFLMSRGRSAAFLIEPLSHQAEGEYQEVSTAYHCCCVHHVDVLFASTHSREQRLRTRRRF